jgi:glycerol-3-phosphate dehydrogenase
MTVEYDLLVVGAGINGAGVALAAAAAGHSVLVCEQTAIAAGTSSRSSKLIHGGLRYLEQLDLRLVREGLAERAWLLAHAPELVRLVPFHIPVYRGTRRRPWQIGVGLALYGLLGGGGFSRVPRRQWAALDGLDTHGLEAVLRYADAATDDAALTRTVLAAAVRLGAEVRIPATVAAIRLLHTGCAIDLRQAGGGALLGGTDRTEEIRARVVVTAAGPWVGEVLAAVTPAQPAPTIDLVVGTHIVVEGRLSTGFYYVEVPEDGRAVFCMPWHGATLVGTTERPYRGVPAAIAPLPEEVDYLLGLLRRYFPRYGGAPVREAFAGARVLPAAPGATFARSREVVFTTDRPRPAGHTPPRLVNILGGKLTAFRATARKALEIARPALPTRPPRATWDAIRLPPAPPGTEGLP